MFIDLARRGLLIAYGYKTFPYLDFLLLAVLYLYEQGILKLTQQVLIL